MRQLIAVLAASMLALTTLSTYAQSGPVPRFHKVIISPYIQVTFVEGDEPGVTIDQIIVDSSKLHVEVQDGTLRLYLDGAKEIPKTSGIIRAMAAGIAIISIPTMP